MNCEEAQMLMVGEESEISEKQRQDLLEHVKSCEKCYEMMETVKELEHFHDDERRIVALGDKIMKDISDSIKENSSKKKMEKIFPSGYWKLSIITILVLCILVILYFLAQYLLFQASQTPKTNEESEKITNPPDDPHDKYPIKITIDGKKDILTENTQFFPVPESDKLVLQGIKESGYVYFFYQYPNNPFPSIDWDKNLLSPSKTRVDFSYEYVKSLRIFFFIFESGLGKEDQNRLAEALQDTIDNIDYDVWKDPNSYRQFHLGPEENKEMKQSFVQLDIHTIDCRKDGLDKIINDNFDQLKKEIMQEDNFRPKTIFFLHTPFVLTDKDNHPIYNIGGTGVPNIFLWRESHLFGYTYTREDKKIYPVHKLSLLNKKNDSIQISSIDWPKMTAQKFYFCCVFDEKEPIHVEVLQDWLANNDDIVKNISAPTFIYSKELQRKLFVIGAEENE